MTPDLVEQGRALRDRRHAIGLTLDQLAGIVGLSTAQISRIERGRAQPSYSALLRLRDAVGLGVPAHLATAAPRPYPDDRVVARLGALLAARRTLPLGEAGALLEASVPTVRGAAVELGDRLAPLGMTVVEDGHILALLPHGACAAVVAGAVELGSIPEPAAAAYETGEGQA